MTNISTHHNSTLVLKIKFWNQESSSIDLVKPGDYSMPKMMKIWTCADENYGDEH
jgi:hypothetical protein